MTGGPERFLTDRAVSGVSWRYGGMVARTFLQIGFLAVLARLLTPEMFGIVGMAGLVMTFTGFFAQMGLGQALVQKADLDAADVSYVFTLSALLGAAMAAAIWIASPAIAAAFGEPRVAPVLRFMGLAYVLIGLSTASLNLMRRDLDFRTLAAINVVSYVVGYGGVGVALALTGHGIWSLAIASVVTTGVEAALAIALRRPPPRLSLRSPAGGSILSYGSRHGAAALVDVIATMADGIVVARVLGAEALAFYTRAQTLVNVPLNQVSLATSQVLFSALSRRQRTVEIMANAARTTTVFIAAAVFPVGFAAAVAAEEIVLTVLGGNWTATVPLLVVFAVMAPFYALTVAANATLDALGLLNRKIALQLLNLAAIVVALWLTVGHGLVAVATGIAVVAVGRAVATQSLVSRGLGRAAFGWVADLVPGLMVSAATVAAVLAVGQAAGGLPPPLRLAAQILAAGGVAAVIVFRYPPRALGDAAATIQRFTANAPGGGGVLQRVVGRVAAGKRTRP